MARSPRLLALVGALAVVLAVVLAACGSDGSDASPMNLRRAETVIRTRAEQALGGEATIGRVRCPGRVDQQRGVTFGCTVQVDDQALPYVVRVTNSAGAVHIEQAASLLVTDKVERFIADYAADNSEQVQSVDCGPTRYLVRARGTKVSCEVVRADGSRIPAVVGVRDALGNTALISFGPTKADG
jgi:hypothetical protein